MKHAKIRIEPFKINGRTNYSLYELVDHYRKLLAEIAPPDENTYSFEFSVLLDVALSHIVHQLKWIDTHRTFADDNDSAVRLALDSLGDSATKKDALELLRIKREYFGVEKRHDYYVGLVIKMLDDEYPYRYETHPEPDPSSVFKSVENHYRVRELKNTVSVRNAVGNDPRMLAILATLQGQAPQHVPAQPTPKSSGGNTTKQIPTPIDEFLAELINKRGEGIKQLRDALLDSHDLNRKYTFDGTTLTLKGAHLKQLPIASKQFTVSSRNLSARKKKLKELCLIE